jgi:NADPH2:quinone reductase
VGTGVSALRTGMRVLATGYYGGYAEAVAFREHEVLPIPDTMPFTTAAAFYIASNTSLYALQDRARLLPGESLLVLGAGSGAGLTAIEIGKALGARVVGAASSTEKLALARKHGADATLHYPVGPLDLDAQKAFAAQLRELSGGAGFAVIYDGVGGTYAEPALRSLAKRGRYLAIGFAAGVPLVPLSVALFRNADIMGIELSAPEAARAASQSCRRCQAVAVVRGRACSGPRSRRHFRSSRQRPLSGCCSTAVQPGASC